MSDDLVAFLKARLDEDERDRFDYHDRFCADCTCGYPARIDREIAAKRAIIADHAADSDLRWCLTCDPGFSNLGASYPCRTVRIIAAVYADHPDYRPEWKP